MAIVLHAMQSFSLFLDMKIRLLLCIILLLVAKQLFSQAKMRKLPPNINHTPINNYAPYVSLDGNSLVYLSDVGEDYTLTMNFSVRDGIEWRDPVVMPKNVNNHLNFLRGYGLSADGNTLFFTSTKYNGIGGYDILTSQRSGNLWNEPVNPGLPLNSKSNDGAPSPSADGNTLYFMKCEVMSTTSADKCKIMMVKKKANGQWDEPTELPPNINSGNSQTPRIMGDGETLIFSSNKLQPNKGGMDLYMTRFMNGQWSSPQPMDFVNTPADDQFVTASSLGRYLVKDSPGQRSSELLEVLFPPELRPKKTITILGTVSGPTNPSSAFVSIFNMKDQSRVFSTKPGKDGTFAAYVNEGGVYDVSVDPEADNFTFYSKVIDLTGERTSTTEKVVVSLKAAGSGDEVALEGISFLPGSSDIDPVSAQELRRASRLMSGNPNKYFSIMITLQGYEVDSVRSKPDLTEVHTDTIKVPVMVKIDSVTTETRDSLVIKNHYHNNRTEKQAKSLKEYFVKQGIPAGHLAISGKAEVEAVIENRRTLVKLVIH